MKADTRRARLIMELRQGGVTDRATLAAIEQVPRDAFVPEIWKERAWENSALPLKAGQTISQPLVVGLMTQGLELEKRHKVLEIGTGSGYQTAILARLCRRVYTIERLRELSVEAQRTFAALGIRNVTAMVGDGSKGWPDQAPFDRIIVTAAARLPPQPLIDQLAEGGILICPVGVGEDDQELVRLRKTEDGIVHERMAGVRFVPLIEGRTG
jgi:protein-L-isoaspartate(D-aspartate) O-methyltransferase